MSYWLDWEPHQTVHSTVPKPLLMSADWVFLPHSNYSTALQLCAALLSLQSVNTQGLCLICLRSPRSQDRAEAQYTLS